MLYTSGVIPEVEDLFQRQARETDVKKREALIHQIQGILHERVVYVPIYELAFIWDVGPRVEEPGINLIRSFAYSGPLEDLRAIMTAKIPLLGGVVGPWPLPCSARARERSFYWAAASAFRKSASEKP